MLDILSSDHGLRLTFYQASPLGRLLLPSALLILPLPFAESLAIFRCPTGVIIRLWKAPQKIRTDVWCYCCLPAVATVL